MTFWESVLLGVIQGIFMFFPVSSTSHLVLTQHFLIQQGSALPSPDLPEMILFDLMVHVGTLVSMAVVFRKSLAAFIRSLTSGLSRGFSGPSRIRERLTLRLTLLGLLSVAVTGLIGFPLKSRFEVVFGQPAIISGTLAVTGLLLWWTDVLPPRKVGLRQIGIGTAILIGAAQGFALLPGLSRSGVTIAVALFAGLRRRWAAEYSFFIAFPTILGATLLQGIEVAGAGGIEGVSVWSFLVGFVVSAVVGIFALLVVLRLLYRARFRFFAYYVWVLAAFIAVGVYLGWLPADLFPH